MWTSIFSRIARVIAVLMLLTTSCLLAAGTGWAGGPTSALMVAPELGRAAALYYSDAEYQQLETLLAEPATSSAPAELPAGGSGYITVSWLIHDVSIWRIDRVFLAKSGDHVIVTQLMDGSDGGGGGMLPGELGDATAIRHRAADPAALQALMDKLGLTAAAPARSADLALPAAPVETDQAGSILSPSSPAAAWWWAAAGLVVGIGGTALAIRYLPGVRRRVFTEARVADDEPARMIQLPVHGG